MESQRPTRRLVLILAVAAAVALVVHQAGLLEQRPAGRAARMTPARAARLLAERPDTIVLDVNTPLEFRQGHIPGAEHLDYHSPYFAAALKGMDREAPYLICSAEGRRSRLAAEHMAEMGFIDVRDLAGGLRAWTKAGHPVQTGE